MVAMMFTSVAMMFTKLADEHHRANEAYKASYDNNFSDDVHVQQIEHHRHHFPPPTNKQSDKSNPILSVNAVLPAGIYRRWGRNVQTLHVIHPRAAFSVHVGVS
jgi:hypothetical protein